MGTDFSKKYPENSDPKRFTFYNYQYLSIAVLHKSKEIIVPVFTHSHPEYEFLIPVTPIPYLFLENGIYYGECGKVYPVGSEKPHGIAYELKNVSHIDITIDKDFFEKTVANIPNVTSLSFNHEFEVTPRLNNLMNLFKEEVSSKNPCKNFLDHLCALIATELALCGLTDTIDTRHNSKYPKVYSVREIADYIFSNLGNDISIDDLSSLCNLSPFHFIRTFKNCFGDTPHNYLVKARLSLAKLLLENTDYPLTEISLKCGFPTPNRFSEVFRQKIKMTPTEYRRGFNKNMNPNIAKAVE